METIVIGATEVAEVVPSPPDQPRRLEPKLPPPIPVWIRAAMIPLILFLPVLCLVTIVLRFAMRGLPPRTRIAWLSFLSTLLIISGILTSAAAVLSVAFVPLPAIVSGNLVELDAKTSFPALPTASPLDAKEVSEELKPLVAVISPARRTWTSNSELPSNSFGAGVLLYAGDPFEKTKAARRLIPMTDDVSAVLKRRVEDADSLATPFVFPSPLNVQKPIGSVKKAHRTAARRAQIKGSFRLYDLRHTFATRAAAADMSLPTLAAILGHTSIQMTMRYVHPAAEEKRLAMQNFEKFRAKGIISPAAAIQSHGVPTKVTTPGAGELMKTMRKLLKRVVRPRGRL